MPYFLAWHRGYIHLLEQKIASVSGVADFKLPYWDYYTTPTLPQEFTQDGAANPLWHSRRGLNVYNALTLAPFRPNVTSFQQGLPNAFEPSIESLPHNQVHNLIGDIMASLQSPQDPIFWVHHCNIDRLWTAWAAAGAGRAMPGPTDPYWSGRFQLCPGRSPCTQACNA